jgi:predicted NAD/FAD-dependent oxidoreductase
LAGLTAARRLAGSSVLVDGAPRPTQVTVVDKAKGPGGRLATRRMKGGPAFDGAEALLDHGAQFFTVRSPEFQADVDRWIEADIVAPWCNGFPSTIDNPDLEVDGHPRYRTNGGMNRLAKHLVEELRGQGVDIVGRQRAEAIIKGPDAWTVTYEAHTRDPDDADAVIATPPVPQTIDLLAAGVALPGPELSDRLRSITYHPVIGILAALDQPPALPAPGALQRPDHPVFTFVADNQAKGISPVPALTAHLHHDLSAELYDADDATVLARVDDDLQSLLGSATATSVQVKRWRYAAPVAPSDEGSLLVGIEPGPLILAGDAFAGSKVEGAFTSGLHAANRILNPGK